MTIDEKYLEKAYKKLKSSVYFDKTQLILRNAIVEFEYNHINIDNYLKDLFEQLKSKEKFEKLSQKILDSIFVLSFPKKMYDNNCDIIMNSAPKNNKVKELQNFIDMKVEGHILGVLWIMLIGYKIDKKIYEHSYGNRIRKNLINELSDNPTYSPYLFEPYFEQYESWRDKALSEASKHMSLKQDVVIITMDFRRYYYSIDADESVFKVLYEEAFSDDENEYSLEETDIFERLNSFVCNVILRYSELFGKEYNGRHILPIGFLPSNVIGNWCLKNFDKAVIDGWNPIYYGRYVDDVLIVDKVEHNSDIYNKAKKNELSRETVIDFFLKSCTKWVGLTNTDCKKRSEYALITENQKETQKVKEENFGNNVCVYQVNPYYNVVAGNKSEIIVHNDKVKIFYFKSGETDALLTCFKENISKSKSEFRHLPEDEAVFQKDDYNEIYNLNISDTINKFRGVDGISLDKFALSKFLGKYLRIGGLIEDKIESKFEKDILKIFNLRAIVENYTTWEKIIEIFVINERFNAIEAFIKQIIKAIETIDYKSDNSMMISDDIKRTLYLFLHSVICRTFALVWKDEIKELQSKIYSIESFADNIPIKYNINGNCDNYLFKLREAYCQTCMIDKSVMPIIIFMISKEDFLSDDTNVNLTHFNDVLPFLRNEWSSKYKYYPYLVNMYDFCMADCIDQLKEDRPFADMEEIHAQQLYKYITSNYNVKYSNKSKSITINSINVSKTAYQVSVGNNIKSKLKIAIANVKLDHQNFKMLVKDKPNRSYKRYHDLSLVVNQAIDQKADMLIMPEAFVPYEWLSTLARTCARNNLAVVTGVEHIKYNEKVFNYTAVILPYVENKHRCAYISFHLKTQYSPSEKEEINGYRLTAVEGEHYELYKWNNCYFPVYCCYELTSIFDRALFQSYADMLIAVEWNKDTNYYSNIMESLSRDIHCYCIQVNTSDYGDSRITQPTKTEEKDIIRTKGGMNNTILIGEIDIDKLRDFQLKEHALQKRDMRFKPTPPDFNTGIIINKIKNENIDK